MLIKRGGVNLAPMLPPTRITLLCFFLNILFVAGFAGTNPDSLSVSLTVLNEMNQPLESAVVTLHQSENNSIVKTELTDKKGDANLIQVLKREHEHENTGTQALEDYFYIRPRYCIWEL